MYISIYLYIFCVILDPLTLSVWMRLITHLRQHYAHSNRLSCHFNAIALTFLEAERRHRCGSDPLFLWSIRHSVLERMVECSSAGDPAEGYTVYACLFC